MCSSFSRFLSVPRHYERSEAIQSRAKELDCFVADAPRNDEAVRRTLVELNHAPHRFAGLHGGKTVIDLFQLQLGGNPIVEMQLALEIELDEARHVLAEMIRAHRR